MYFDCLGVTDPLDAYEIGTVYYTQNGKVVRQTWGSDYMDFIYDNNGNPYALKYNDYTYFYVLNQQGDVIKIINYSGAEVASYIYDAWGNILSKSGWMADANPLRYPYAKKTLGKIFAVTTARMAMGSTASRYYYKRCVVS